jgi:hypothetical protein
MKPIIWRSLDTPPPSKNIGVASQKRSNKCYLPWVSDDGYVDGNQMPNYNE